MIFQYYVPGIGAENVDVALILRLGLEEVFFDCTGRDFEEAVIRTPVAKGPDGSSGAIFAPVPVDRSISPLAGYHPDRQTWVEIAAGYWLGSETDNPPSPESLRRRHITRGLDLELGDGRVWTAPTIRAPNGRCYLPSTWGVDSEGQFRETILPDYESYWEMAGEVWDLCFGKTECDYADSFGYAARALGLNYRVGPHEVSRLGLLSSANYLQVFKTVIDGQLIEEFIESPAGQAALQEVFQNPPAEAAEKKRDEPPPDGSTSPGPEADSPTTDPAAESST
jgi:hypothetical protein